MALFREFKEFVSRGNVLDLAVAVVLGVAFTAIVTALVEGLIMPLVALVLPTAEWQTWAPGGFAIGLVLAAIVNFVVIAAIVFLVVVKAAGALMRRPPPEPTRACPECFEVIPIAASRCRACGQPVPVTT